MLSRIVPIAGAVLLAACSDLSAPQAAPTSPATAAGAAAAGPVRSVSVQPAAGPGALVTGLAAPWSIVFVRGSALVSERDSGRIVEVGPGTPIREVGFVAGVEHVGEGGLLGLTALTAAGHSYLYVYFTGAVDNRIVRYPLAGQTGSFTLGPVEAIIEGIPKSSNHNGGRIKFGPDGMLYATTGDAQNKDSAQDPNSLSGKILRLTPEGRVPADNPIAGNPLYSMGHRNPQGIAWDSHGTLWADEFGQNTWDELNSIRPGGNYGWPIVEGIAGDARFIDPVLQWMPSEASPSGLAIVNDTLFMANLRGQRLTVIDPGQPVSATDYFTGEFGRLRDVVAAPDDTLWVLTNNTDGRGDPRAGDDRVLQIKLTPK